MGSTARSGETAGEATGQAKPRGFTALLHAAATSGGDRLGDEFESLAERLAQYAAFDDPQQRLRDRCAAQLLQAAARRVAAGAPRAVLVDVGSGLGRDAGAWRARAEAGGLGADRLDVVGVELLQALNDRAAAEHPSCRFVAGDVAALPFEPCSVDGVHCSRLLLHTADIARAIDEMVRVLRPGGLGVFQEGDYATNAIMSGDPRVTAVFRAMSHALIAKMANPHAARVAHTLLLARSDVENVALESDSLFFLDMEAMDPGLSYMRQSLDALVEAGTVTRTDADHYAQCIRDAPRVGEPVITGGMFKITFTKKC